MLHARDSAIIWQDDTSSLGERGGGGGGARQLNPRLHWQSVASSSSLFKLETTQFTNAILQDDREERRNGINVENVCVGGQVAKKGRRRWTRLKTIHNVFFFFKRRLRCSSLNASIVQDDISPSSINDPFLSLWRSLKTRHRWLWRWRSPLSTCENDATTSSMLEIRQRRKYCEPCHERTLISSLISISVNRMYATHRKMQASSHDDRLQCNHTNVRANWIHRSEAYTQQNIYHDTEVAICTIVKTLEIACSTTHANGAMVSVNSYFLIHH